MSLTNVSVSRNHAATVSSTTQRPPWLDEQLYPFQSRFVEVEGNRIHYIDEGAGPTLFFVHPGVGWSFMYSDIIQELRGRFRCVALDLPGFGLSAAAPGFEHTLTGDSRLLERFISTLGLTDVTLFSHDVTGSIALGVVARRPVWFRAVIVLPSFAWPLESYRKVYPMIQVIGSPLFRFLSTHFNFFLEYTLRAVTKKPKQPFSDLEKQAYRGPNLDRTLRRYPHDLYKSVTKSHDYLADLEQRLSAISAPIRPANDAGASTAAQSGGTSGEGDASAADLWRGCYNQNGVVGSPGAHLSPAPLHRDAGVPPFSQVYDASAVAAAIRSWWDEEIAS